VKAGADRSIEIDLREASAAEPEMVYVPGGPALLGGEDGQDLREVDVRPFFLGEHPVTFAAYLAFVAEVYKENPKKAQAYVPSSSEGTPYWKWDGRAFVLAEAGLFGAEGREILSWPVLGVDVTSANAYVEWLSRRTRKPYRLPNENEWEKAARGVDGRRYPWGDEFDASFCHMRQSRPGVPAPEASGKFAVDVSPYGVRDLAGGVADWMRPAPSAITAVSRGGAWCDWAADCRVGVRRYYWAQERSARVGFRLARNA
jgi:serine/threonine-protein kinase